MIGNYETTDFSKAHWLLLKFIGNVIKNDKGILDLKYLKLNPKTHALTKYCGWDWSDEYSTKGKSHTIIGHDDLDVLLELISNGLIEAKENGLETLSLNFTEDGTKLVQELLIFNGPLNNFIIKI